MWTNRITYNNEFILKKQEKANLEDGSVYLVYVGSVALGRRVVEEQEFIVGKTGRAVQALRTSSLIKLHFMKQHY